MPRKIYVPDVKPVPVSVSVWGSGALLERLAGETDVIVSGVLTTLKLPWATTSALAAMLSGLLELVTVVY